MTQLDAHKAARKENLVCKLKKSLQIELVSKTVDWKFDQFMTTNKYTRSYYDHCGILKEP